MVTPEYVYVTLTLRSPQLKDSRKSLNSTQFESILQENVPKGRDGKHRAIVEQLLSDLAQLQAGSALKVPLSALPDSKENIRAALSRATRNRKIEIATSSDDEFLYIWKPVDPGLRRKA